MTELTALVVQQHGRATADSTDIATAFERRHDNVLRAIDSLLAEAPELSLNFEEVFVPVATGNGGTRETRVFRMDRDGFALLAMGFTGSQALKWKLAYIGAFNTLEATLKAQRGRLAALDDPKQLRASLAFVRAARVASKCATSQRAWKEAGLPDVFEAAPAGAIAGNIAPDPQIAGWFAERVDRQPSARTSSTALYEDYSAWTDARGLSRITVTTFGRMLTAMGIRGFNSNGIKREGVALRDEAAA